MSKPEGSYLVELPNGKFITLINLCPHTIDINYNNNDIIIPDGNWYARRKGNRGGSFSYSDKNSIYINDSIRVSKMNEDVWLYNVDKQTKIDFPPEVRGTFYIVSKITALCLEHRHDILVPDTKNKDSVKYTRGFICNNERTLDKIKELIGDEEE
tara:strand:- start:4238 stop:4702 length:465 start_codon:yes stop_codon:yes gene_type:complete